MRRFDAGAMHDEILKLQIKRDQHPDRPPLNIAFGKESGALSTMQGRRCDIPYHRYMRNINRIEGQEGISGRKERSAYAVEQQRPASAICSEKDQEPQVWVSVDNKEQGLKTIKENHKIETRVEKNETFVEKTGSGSEGGEIVESIWDFGEFVKVALG